MCVLSIYQNLHLFFKDTNHGYNIIIFEWNYLDVNVLPFLE